ncbi:response regulator transcription factor [Halalkalibacter okhensis]|uniref:AraC family transcriptional regulator n=1 Tax=Halalkalibacter okhensis TaxID=333138 RepID=A0A0B0II55_9BACI|nr:response regulator [Halalkalibacter okhensis]KHF40562.1 hypothetical protein LQ50_08540 [Halalkalibacter okhensis]
MYRVLVVEDEYWMCEGLCKMIDKLDIDFTVADVAHNGSEALQKLKNDRFDLVLSDIRMPVMDGLEFMKSMNSLNLHLPVVIITGHNEFEYARTAFRLGAIDYLLKPIKSSELRDILENCREQLSESTGHSEENTVDLNEQNKGVELIQSILKLIESSYKEDLSLSIIAEQAGFNASYLSRLFKLEAGKGFVQYLREVRMKHACQFLLESEMTIDQVAKSVGFMDEKHFRRTFKKDLGTTPGEYRRIQKSKK